MTDLAPRPPSAVAHREEADRGMGKLIYGLFLVSPFTLGLSALAGALVAAHRKEQADDVAASHYRFQIWTFWGTVGVAATGTLWFTLGALESLAPAKGDGAWLAAAGSVLWGAAAVGYFGATLYGLSRLLAHSPISKLLRRR